MWSSARVLTIASVVVAILVTPAAVSAAPASTNFAVSGSEYGFTRTLGLFAGTAAGNAAETALWNARVEHDPLGSIPTYVTGGSFVMGTRGSALKVDWVRGAFVDHGGTITKIIPGTNCTKEQYLVVGALQNVSTSTTSGGTGFLHVTLTHHRARVFGRCLTYRATVAGAARFQY
jgi:hypothetical protein